MLKQLRTNRILRCVGSGTGAWLPQNGCDRKERRRKTGKGSAHIGWWEEGEKQLYFTKPKHNCFPSVSCATLLGELVHFNLKWRVRRKEPKKFCQPSVTWLIDSQRFGIRSAIPLLSVTFLSSSYFLPPHSLTHIAHKTAEFTLSCISGPKPAASMPPHNFSSSEWPTRLNSETYKHRSVKQEYQTELVCVNPPHPHPEFPSMIRPRGPSHTAQKEWIRLPSGPVTGDFDSPNTLTALSFLKESVREIPLMRHADPFSIVE